LATVTVAGENVIFIILMVTVPGLLPPELGVPELLLLQENCVYEIIKRNATIAKRHVFFIF
jgi:hypothetical protein